MPWRKGNKLKLVPENEADERTRQIYNEIRSAFGIPNVHLIFQAFAAYPAFLQLHWRALKPAVASKGFFELAERLRADAYTRMHNYFEVPDLCAQTAMVELSEGAKEELTRTVDLCHYSASLLLLVLAAQLQAFDTPVGQKTVGEKPSSHPTFADRPILVEDTGAPPQTRQIYEEMRHVFDLPIIPTEYRALARYPGFMKAYWDALRTVVQSPVYEGCHYGVRETAFALAREFPDSFDVNLSQLTEAGLSDEDVGSIVRIVEMLVNAMSGTALNVAFAKIGMEGGSRRAKASDREKLQPAKDASKHDTSKHVA